MDRSYLFSLNLPQAMLAGGDSGMPTAIWIGDSETPAFASTFEALKCRLRVVVASGLDEARPIESADCLLAILAEQYPGEYAHAAGLDRFRLRKPAMPILRLCGPGCDGELRSGSPPTLHRYAWHDAARALTADLDAILRGACPSWGQPVTLGRDEALCTATDDSASRIPAGVRIGLCCDDSAVHSWLSDVVRAWRGELVEFSARAIAASAMDLSIRHLGHDGVASIVASISSPTPCPLIVLTSFLRNAEIDRLHAAGVQGVLALPAEAAVLEALVCRSLSPRVRRGTAPRLRDLSAKRTESD